MIDKPTTRNLKTRVKTAKKRKLSSSLWLERQLNDPYVLRAKKEGYRSRAAYKLLEIDEKFKFLFKGQVVIDLGAAPGGWTQVAVKKVKPGITGGGKVVGIDLSPMEEIEGAILIQQDFLSDEAEELLRSLIDGKANVVLSDMAAGACGHAGTDHLRIIGLCEAAFEFAKTVLVENGVFVAKILKGGTEHNLLTELKQNFKQIKHFKPPASREDSAESYVVAIGFKA